MDHHNPPTPKGDSLNSFKSSTNGSLKPGTSSREASTDTVLLKSAIGQWQISGVPVDEPLLHSSPCSSVEYIPMARPPMDAVGQSLRSGEPVDRPLPHSSSRSSGEYQPMVFRHWMPLWTGTLLTFLLARRCRSMSTSIKLT